MMHLATQISNKVNQLYTSRADRERAEAEEQERRMQQAEEGDGSATGDIAALIEAVEEAEEKESSASSGSSSDEEEEIPEDYDSELEDYDHEAAGERIAFMLEGLKCQERTDIMDSLSTFYQSKMEGINDNQEELQKLEADYHTREEETKDSLASMVKAFESKGMTEVQVLVKCSATLQAGANGTFRQRQRQKFSRAARKKAREEKAKSQTELAEEEEEEKGEKGDETRDSTPKPKRKLKPLFEDEVKPEEELEEEEEEMYVASVRSEELKDQDIWDLNRARELWNKMNEKAAKVAGGRGPAIEILQAMVVVQEGNAELLRRAEMAKKATATLSDTIDFLAKNVQAGVVIDFEHPAEEDEALVLSAQQLKDRLLQEIDLDELEEGLDPEELEEECQDLERILQEQERDIEALYKQREEKAAAQEEQNNSKLEKALGDDDGAPKANKSVFMDGRLEGIKIQGQGEEKSATGGMSISEKMKQAAKTAAAISSIKKTVGQAAAAPRLHSPEDFKDDPKVKMLREHIATKDAQLEQGQRLLRRMRYERKLLRYCQKKATAGFDDIVKEFAPPSLDHFVDDGEVSEDEKEVKEEPKQEQPPERSPDEEQVSSASEAAEVEEETSQGKADKKAKGKAAEASPKAVPRVAKKILEKSAESGEGKEAESDLKKEVDRLQEELTNKANDLKEEKNKQKTLRKEIKDLRKEFHSLAERNTPKTVEGIQEQIQREEEKHGELQREIQALKVKLGYAEEVPEVDESELFLPEEPANAAGDPAAPAEAETAEEELTLELPVTLRRSGTTVEQADGPTASPDGHQGAADSPTLARQSSQTASPRAASPRSPGSPRSPRAEESRSLSPRPADSNLSRRSSHASADASPKLGTGLQEAPAFPGIDPDDALEDTEELQEDPNERLSSEAPVPNDDGYDPVPQRFLTMELTESAGKGDAAEASISVAVATLSRPTLTTLVEPGGISVPLNAGEEASASMAELMKTQSKTEEMREEIHDIDVKLKKLKALMKSKGNADSVVASVREILGINNEEEVKAPAEYHQKKKELKEQQDRVRVLRKKWWDDHRDFDGLVEKVRNQMGGLHQLFTGPEGKLAQEVMEGGGSEQIYQPEASEKVSTGSKNPRGRVRGSMAAANAHGGKGGPGKGGRRLSGLIGFGAGVRAMVDGPVQGTQSAGPRHRFSMIQSATNSLATAVGDESESYRERRTLSSLLG